VTVTELILTGALPVEFKVKAFVAAEFCATRPNEMLDVLRLNIGVEGPSCKVKVSETPPAVAVRVADWLEVTVETVAENPMLEAFTGTVTEAGRLTAGLLLARLTFNPPLVKVEVSDTVQESAPAPVIDALLHDRALNVGVACVAPVPLKSITSVAFTDESLTRIN
jgi:hypothetical protein